MKTIKTYLATTCALLLLTSGLFAQLSVGFKGGAVRAWEYYGPDVLLPEDARIHVNRIHAAVTLFGDLTPHLKVGVEPGFIQRGAACIPGFIGFVGDSRLLLDYVEIPVIFMPHLPLAQGKIDLYSKIGYGFAAVVKAQQVQVDNLEAEISRTRLAVNGDGVTPFDLGLHAGLGITINVGKIGFQLEGRYYYGIPNAAVALVSQNRNLSVGLGITTSL